MYGKLMLVRRRGGQSVYFLLGLLAAGAASANPQGAQVAAGAASFVTPNPQTLEITNSPSAILNWQSFDIGAGETTRFIQQDAASAVLNRVTTQNSSEIFGNLVSNGQVFLINPSGILIGRDASVDTAGLVMSTLQMSDADFLAGRLHFEGDAASGPLINHGYIKTGPGGEIVLIAPTIENSPDGGGANSGLIESAGGELILAAGHSITIASLDHPDITFEVQAPTNEVINLGKLLADGGSINVLAGTIRHSGEINADSLSLDAAGHIVLAARSKVVLDESSITSASGAGAGGDIEITAGGTAEGGRVYQMGAVRADGASGGTVTVEAARVLASGALSARGSVDGGRIEVKADDQILATSASHMDASGVAGHGGTVVVDGGKNIYTSGLVQATGAVGGTVHVFGDSTRLAAATIDASGVAGGGTVRVGGGFQGGENLPTADTTEVNGSSVIKADALSSGNGGSVALWADGTMRYAGTISAHGGAQSGNGGTVEVSGKDALGFNGVVDVTAPAGQVGSLLLDPKNVRFTSETLTGAPISLLDPNPGTGNNFGNGLDFLYEDGNFSTPAKFIVYDDLDDFGGADAGAVYLFRASDGALLSTLTGDHAGDRIGNSNSLQSLGTLSLLRSPLWNSSRGALTPFDRVNGTSGVVDDTNSVVGANAGDKIGSDQFGNTFFGGNFGVTLLDSTRAVIRSPEFNGTRGALSVVSLSSFKGQVSSLNSLLGVNVGDRLSQNSLINLGAGNWLQRSTHGTLGAVTFFNAAALPLGAVTSGNSLVGVNPGDDIGGTDIELTYGNTYVVRSAAFGAGRGALTFASRSTGRTGQVSNLNSLVGVNTTDNVSFNDLIDLGIGSKYLLQSPHGGLGAVTFIDPTAPPTDFVGAANSLVGVSSTDNIGSDGVDLTYGNTYAVRSSGFGGGLGAVTFASRTSGLIGQVTSANSLVGANTTDNVGFNALIDLNNFSNYLLRSSHGGLGAVTFINPTAAPVGQVGIANSLVGIISGDDVGATNVELTFGNTYVVRSANFGGGAGALTFGSRSTGVIGQVTTINSLIGANASDALSSEDLVDLNNGSHYVQRSANGGRGAVTFINPLAAPTGLVGAGNSFVGTLTTDDVGSGGIEEIAGSVWAVFSPTWGPSLGQDNAGAVTLFDASNGQFSGTGVIFAGALSSANSLVGDSQNDQVGVDGIDYAFGSNYGVFSTLWDDAGVFDRGAITWFIPGNALNGVVSAANSLVGGFGGDGVGGDVIDALLSSSQPDALHGIFSLGDTGNAILKIPGFHSNAGAVTFLDAAGTGPIGVVSSGNSLIGNPSDQVGVDGIAVVDNVGTSFDYYVVVSSSWDAGGTLPNAGAVSVVRSDTGLSALVGGLNSLVGGASGHAIGSGGVMTLSSGNALVLSPLFQSGAGAVTFLGLNVGHLIGDSDFGAILDQTNSLVGGTAGDGIGTPGSIDEFFNGVTTFYYGVFSPSFDNTDALWLDAGAITFADSNSGVAGLVSSSNSLVGASADGDSIGLGKNYVVLSNHNIVLLNPQWNNDTGAATFVDIVNGIGMTGDISSSNSVVGSQTDDRVGSGGIVEFGNSRFAILSPEWANGGNTTAGAVTWGNIDTGVSGVLGLGNSLVGQSTADRIGDDSDDFESVTGNLWVLNTPRWSGNKSALTFFDISGTLPTGEVDASNSLVGSTSGDNLGSDGFDLVFAGSGIHVLVRSSLWDNGANTDAGAITAFLTSNPTSGVITAGNSLIGSHTDDAIGAGYRVFLNSSGNQLLVNASWNADRGAVTFWDPDNALTGVVDASNSLVGGTAGDLLGNWEVLEVAGGKYYVAAPDWSNDTGSVTFGSTSTGVVGLVTDQNSLVGSTSGDRIGETIHDLFYNDRLAVVSQTWNANRGAVTFINPLAPVIGQVSAGNSIVGASAGDRVGTSLTQLFGTANRGTVVLRTTTFNSNAGAVTVVDSDAPFIGVVSELNSLVGRPGDRVGLNGVSEQNNGAVLVRSAQWSDGTSSNFGAVTLMPATAGALTPVTGFVSALNSLVGSHTGDAIGSGSTTTSAGNLILSSTAWNGNRGAVTFMNINNAKTGVVSSQNSLVGELGGDFIGNGGTSSLGGDRFMVFSPNASVNGLANAGRLDIIDGAIAQDVDGNIDFGSDPGGELLISIGSLVNFLNSGGTLNVQATNDIIIGLGQSIVTSGGSLFLQAGRSIEIGADLILNGPGSKLSMIANDGGTDPQFRDSGDGNVTLKAGDGPLRVMATTLIVEAQNIVLEAGTMPGASVALVGLGTAELHAHGSGLISLTGGTAPGSLLTGASSQDIFANFLADPTTLTAPASFILGQNSLKLTADDIVLQGGGSDGAFAAVVSFGEFTVKAINIELLTGSAINADALLLGLGGVAELEYTHCEFCAVPFFGDPLADSSAQAGVYISGVFDVFSIIGGSILPRSNDKDGDGEDDDDEDDENLECN